MKPTHVIAGAISFVLTFFSTLILHIFFSPLIAGKAAHRAFWMTALKVLELEEKRREAD